MRIDPWGSSQYQDYARLRDEFGIATFGQDEVAAFPSPHKLFRRGIVFGHRDFERVRDAIKGHDPWSVMTGFMPSGPLHLGHKMVLEQVLAHQQAGADVHLALADFEAMAARHMTLQATQDIARREYVHNALALGLDGSSRPFYFQTRRRRVKDLADSFTQHVSWGTLSKLYGFEADTTMAHALAPFVQAADILHPQLDEVGPRPILVPVGVDQDPHIRLARDLAQATRRFSIQAVKDPVVGLGVFVRPQENVKALLDRVEKVVRGMGYGEIRRNDAYKALYIQGATTGDERRIDLALAQEERKDGPALLRPAATFHRFQTGLTGGKMSSSKPETSIYLTEDPVVAEKKVKSAVTGGRASAEEQRRLGANPDICPVYELYLYHLAENDGHLATVREECSTGKRLCGGCKGEAIGLLRQFLAEHKAKRDQVEHQVAAAISDD